MAITIEITHSNNRQRLVTLNKPVFIIGRSERCDVQLRDDVVSSTHAKIRVYRDHAVVEDLGSANGLFVDNARVSGKAEIGLDSTVEFGAGGPKIRIVDGLEPTALPSRIGASQTSPRNSKRTLVTLVAVGILAFCLLLLAVVSSVGLIAFIVHSKSFSNVVTSKKDEEKLSRAVAFVIHGYEVSTPGGKRSIPISTGSAFVVSPLGYLLTNSHVITEGEVMLTLKQELKSLSGADPTHRVWVAFRGELIDAEILYSGTDYDLGILKVNTTKLPYFRLSLNDNVSRSSTVFAVGFPAEASTAVSEEEKYEELMRQRQLPADIKTFFKQRDFEYSLTSGTVTKLTRESSGRSWITHNTLIGHGNSGGPLCLENGVVVAINTEGVGTTGNVSISLTMPQLRTIIDRYAPGATWTKP